MSDAAREIEAEPRSASISVYLAGPVGHSEDAGMGWREDLEAEYADGFAFNNPLSKYNVPADNLSVVDGVSDADNDETVGVDEIVRGDKQLLEGSDAVLVGYEPVRSIGTPMEVMWAYERDYPIALWPIHGAWESNLSPWYRYHIGHIGPVESCLAYFSEEVDPDV
ncbi:hypothetical protein PhiCh1p75 [Natrialba phage PhiCh1]|nr:hypothetical protein [Natrialba magadii]NP_665992.1 hypothetical protein PhiCh1p75 [Natrialba phage PhiCh1]YP_010078100.1 uncharacterized protein KMC42_gp70 [Natrialba phage PhiCh1]AAM88748.1 unknown [Natrialba phage PhiCh1]ELY22981.1 hypothetical protein C500_20995 [Natrialba magadii ATCC 43099]QBJ01251.1 uncharacterized protein PhiCh1_345 [Natrialba phage PhiCh1]